jgi:hypothetical protein
MNDINFAAIVFTLPEFNRILLKSYRKKQPVVTIRTDIKIEIKLSENSSFMAIII